MTSPLPEHLRKVIEGYARGHRSTLLLLSTLISIADENGGASLDKITIGFRESYLSGFGAGGGDVERESGRLGLDEVRQHLARSVIPRLISEGVLQVDPKELERPDGRIEFAAELWRELASSRAPALQAIRETGEQPSIAPTTDQRPSVAPGGSVLEAEGLLKVYQRRKVVNDVALRLQQGEIVGLLGPNGAGKTTTFYMITGLLKPQAGRIRLDGKDITTMPMYKRARRGIGYLSQEPSIFRKLSVEDNILSILETLKLSSTERKERLEKLLDELSIKHLRKNKAISLSGGERRRLEITRALVTQPKFMMLDEPFAGVDPIAVHDIQSIVAGLKHRRIGVLISDHNVEQTLDIVDRAYIMFDGQVKVSGTVRELVFDETVARLYLGPTLTERLRARLRHSPLER